MRTLLTSSILSLAVLGSLLAGCKETTNDGDDPDGTETPDWEGEPGQEPVAIEAYPAGPFGIEVGSVIENFKFIGFPSPDEAKDSAYVVKMSDFYNPTGTEVYPEGSPYGAGNAKPKALLIAVSAVWCGPCQYENDEILPVHYAAYNPQGAEFLLQLADGPTVGDPAEFTHLVNWTNKYDTAWPAVIDPTSKLGALFEADAFPANIIVDTTTMQIVHVVAGVPEEGGPFYDDLEALLD